MSTLKEEIENMTHYDPCVRVSPAFIATLMKGILVMAEATELSELMSADSVLPKVSGAFTYQGYPIHMRAIEHNGSMYIVFCAYHNGTSGNAGIVYLLYQKDAEGSFKFSVSYTSSTVVDWVKRAFNEATATSTYPGLLSNNLYKKIDAMYNWCVAQGMTTVK